MLRACRSERIHPWRNSRLMRVSTLSIVAIYELHVHSSSASDSDGEKQRVWCPSGQPSDKVELDMKPRVLQSIELRGRFLCGRHAYFICRSWGSLDLSWDGKASGRVRNSSEEAPRFRSTGNPRLRTRSVTAQNCGEFLLTGRRRRTASVGTRGVYETCG
ncbi:hypothetical protein BCR34DRAFT_558483 [Clohesyomyces aquaticus]|uniref:Uncharacterized protein n=1 Tax=Clohesyomyces aquaticus TaxID=1231657 RepID=A0A1Y2A0B6_9PLEO|nr:hypothetical protein BCR34DRAFT_558483 [Clohesyomyces aquaticus]